MGEMHRVSHPRPGPSLEGEGIRAVGMWDPQGSLKHPKLRQQLRQEPNDVAAHDSRDLILRKATLY